MKPMDFLIIGAQKCATTTLFEHLRQHPGINMPLEKEVPFFTGPERDWSDWLAFAEQQFGDDDGRFWGKATPQYMCDPNVPARIHALMPYVKLVAILRDPVQRTRSHYLMGRRRGTEYRTLDQVLPRLLEPEALQRSRCLPVPDHSQGYEDEADFYVTWSEYGRVLQAYLQYFDRSQLLVLYTEDLQRDPESTLDRLMTFIGLPMGFRPDTLGEVMHKGGGSNRIPHGVREWLRQRQLIYSLWQRIPAERQGRLRFLYECWNTRKSSGQEARLQPECEYALRRHFQRDLVHFRELQLDPPPWMQEYSAA
ncbi:sulfotransferase [Halioglobus japonicus]|uniref:Sulfotransferase n=1 Tax=Halioglobus japonicus TaxID=930805 RepID=A0AAP8MEI8_9GAMM|nr:sulfotransferase [Halioglobus japonicus]AQA18362.1 sulfotransferase [Halioglobus japonicus]PLW86380.1 sulfotransferase [Halioglobus japonicus]GHD13191.1 hypothetical protein GCM10007052_15040 [Halioglobus japonicus]